MLLFPFVVIVLNARKAAPYAGASPLLVSENDANSLAANKNFCLVLLRESLAQKHAASSLQATMTKI
jgi:hypothetical protein